MKTWPKLTVVLPALCLAALPLLAQSQGSSGDPVADAARKAREKQKNEPKPKKVYTDDDLAKKPGTPPEVSTAGATAPPTDANASAAAAAAPQGSRKDEEAKWRKRFQDQRDRIARAEKELDVLQREDNKAQIQYYPDPQKALMEQNTRKDINEKNSKIEAKRQEIAALKKGLDDLEDELRKSGGDAGWSR